VELEEPLLADDLAKTFGCHAGAAAVASGWNDAELEHHLRAHYLANTSGCRAVLLSAASQMILAMAPFGMEPAFVAASHCLCHHQDRHSQVETAYHGSAMAQYWWKLEPA